MDYVTVIEPVLEITIAGTVQSRHWETVLKAEELPFAAPNGRANVLLSVIASRYKGFPFQELSISIQVENDRFFLAQAYNSRASFAWVERVLFRTPYHAGKLTTQARRVALHDHTTPIFEAILPQAAVPLTEQWECNELCVHLPKQMRRRSGQPHFFYARLEGQTAIYSGEGVKLSFAPHPRHPVWGLLHAADFQAFQWRVREKARHSKSKTFEGVPAS